MPASKERFAGERLLLCHRKACLEPLVIEKIVKSRLGSTTVSVCMWSLESQNGASWKETYHHTCIMSDTVYYNLHCLHLQRTVNIKFKLSYSTEKIVLCSYLDIKKGTILAGESFDDLSVFTPPATCQVNTFISIKSCWFHWTRTTLYTGSYKRRGIMNTILIEWNYIRMQDSWLLRLSSAFVS